ncbi:MAG: UvrD/REP helicase, partial [uncultured bacterium]
MRAQQQGIGNIYLEPLTLTMNFRSQGNLVSWFNDTFHAVFPAVSDIATGRVPYTKAIAAKEPLPENEAHFYPVISDNDNDEAQLLVEKIKSVQTKNPSDSFAILVRSRAQLIPIVKYLQEQQLSFQAIDIEPLADRPEIRDLLSLTRALLHRADRIAWLAILRAPFCGLTLADLEIIAVTADKKTIWEAITNVDTVQLSADGLQRLKRIRHFLQLAF